MAEVLLDLYARETEVIEFAKSLPGEVLKLSGLNPSVEASTPEALVTLGEQWAVEHGGKRKDESDGQVGFALRFTLESDDRAEIAEQSIRDHLVAKAGDGIDEIPWMTTLILEKDDIAEGGLS